MEYESVKRTAERMGVNVRTVQKWCKENKLKGAKKVGRDWFIPVDCCQDIKDSDSDANPVISEPVPLFNHPFEVGGCLDYINSIEDEDKRNVCLGEYHYYRGDFEKSSQILESYLNDENPNYSFTAAFICAYDHLCDKHTNMAKFSFELVKQHFEKYFPKNTDDKRLQALSVFFMSNVAIQFQYADDEIPKLEDYMKYLPNALKLYSCYLMAYKAYLERDYSRSLGIAETALNCCLNTYPVAAAYNYIIAAVDYMNLMNIKAAKEKIEQAWELVEKDGLIVPFVEHYSLLQGLVEVFFKKQYPEEYKRIVSRAKQFNNTWFALHNEKTGRTVADNLTTTEFIIAMLYNRGWRMKEIATHLELSERTVKNYMQVVYEKLGINNKRELEKFMLK